MRLLICAVALLSSPLRGQCPGASPLEALAPAERAERAAVLAFGRWLGGERADLLARFGAPLRVWSDTARYFGSGLDSAFEWRYAAFSVSLIKSGESGGELSSHVLVDAAMSNAPVSVRVGLADTAIVRRFLGSAALARAVGDTVDMCVPLTGEGEAEEEVRLRFVGGRLRRALWAFYTG